MHIPRLAVGTSALVLSSLVFGEVEIDDGDVAGLIDAIDAANSQPETPAAIHLATDGTYILEDTISAPFGGPVGLPVIETDITIEANGATIKRSNSPETPQFRIMTVLGLSQGYDGSLALRDAKITGGETDHSGAGIGNAGGRLTVTNTRITGNASGLNGGGIAIAYGGTLQVVGSRIEGNRARRGGGISAAPIRANPTVPVVNAAFVDPPPAFRGAGIEIRRAVAITDTAVTGNVASEQGGGVANSHVMLVDSSLITGNTANDSGGGLWSAGTTTRVGETIVCGNGPVPVDGPLTDLGGNEFTSRCPDSDTN